MKCPVCGNKMKMDEESVCTSIPPMYIYKCKNCGKVEYSMERESSSDTKENNPGPVPGCKYSFTTTIDGIEYRFERNDNMICEDCYLYRYNCHSGDGSLKELHGYLCARYRDEFMEMYFTDGEGSRADNFWIGDNIGETLDVAGEYKFDFDTIRYTVDNKIHPDRLFEWLDYCRKVSDFGIKTPTLKDFYHGAPLVSDEQLEKLAKLKQDYENEVERYNDSWEKGGF